MATRLPFDPAEDIAKYGGKPESDTPPKPAATRRTAPKATVTEVPLAQIKSSLTDMYVLAGSILGSYPNPKLAMVGKSITDNHEKCVEAIIEAAKKDAKLRKALSRLTMTSTYGAILVAHLPVLMAIYMAFIMKVEFPFIPEGLDNGSNQDSSVPTNN